MTEVVAALIWDQGTFMLCRRPPHKARGLMWEFPGGKVEPGERSEDAIVRECREELDITLEVQGICTQAFHEYPDISIRLTLFHCRIREGAPRLLEHVDLAWVSPAEAFSYNLSPADRELLEQIRFILALDKKV